MVESCLPILKTARKHSLRRFRAQKVRKRHLEGFLSRLSLSCSAIIQIDGQLHLQQQLPNVRRCSWVESQARRALMLNIISVHD